MQRQVSFTEAVSMGFRNYCCFTGRASRSEYWWWVLFVVLIEAVMSMFGKTGTVLGSIVGLALFLPSLGLFIRRLHDIDKCGWWVLLALIPVVGEIILIIWYVQDSDQRSNQYGPVPNEV